MKNVIYPNKKETILFKTYSRSYPKPGWQILWFATWLFFSTGSKATLAQETSSKLMHFVLYRNYIKEKTSPVFHFELSLIH